MPKAVNHSGFCNKHNCPQRDSIPGPRALQSGMLPLDHCDLHIDIYAHSHTVCIVLSAFFHVNLGQLVALADNLTRGFDANFYRLDILIDSCQYKHTGLHFFGSVLTPVR